MTDVRVIFVSLIVLFILVLGSWVFSLMIGGFIKPFFDDKSGDFEDAPIDETEYLRISDRLFETNDWVFLIAIFLPIFAVFVTFLYKREETPVRGLGSYVDWFERVFEE